MLGLLISFWSRLRERRIRDGRLRREGFGRVREGECRCVGGSSRLYLILASLYVSGEKVRDSLGLNLRFLYVIKKKSG